MGWSDVGSWDALYGLRARDEAQNAVSGSVRLLESWGNLVHSDGIRVSAHGVNDLIIIASGNEVMILPRGQSQNAKKLAE
jgi:mannose-1-phosphate guanylyltransferase/mannose-1-phosphate guanylyltransferase/mannose-6-phosphate isomerase